MNRQGLNCKVVSQSRELQIGAVSDAFILELLRGRLQVQSVIKRGRTQKVR